MKDLKEAIALVTGAGSGIGREIALELARQGCHVVVNDIAREGVERVAEEIRQLGRRALAIVADVSNASKVQGMCQQAIETLGRVDILVNNAGICICGRFEEISMEDWEKILRINLWASIYTTRALLPQMLKRGTGHIVYVSSGAGLFGTGLSAPYNTTKAGLVGFAESFAAQVRSRGIGVTLVCPAFVKTPLFQTVQIRINDSDTRDRFMHFKDRAYAHWSQSPRAVAQKVTWAIRKNRFLLITHWHAKVLLWLHTFFPQLYVRISAGLIRRMGGEYEKS
jgi:NAD(P)-dependent dehydrogenase (short-subunit alcohol dehydrogenase family)